MKTQKVQLAINKFIQINIILFIILLCVNCSNKNQDTSLLGVYFEDYKREHRIDSIFLGSDNINVEIFKSYNRHINSKRKSSDSLKNIIFTKEESENFNSQLIKDGTWNIDFSQFKNVYPETKIQNKDNILYVTKPIYTKNRRYALIYGYNKLRKDQLFFVPLMEVYKQQNNIWKKISTMRHHEVPSSPLHVK